jgi:hypothetical protein
MLGGKSISDVRFGDCIYIMRYWGTRPKSKHEIHLCFMYTLFTQQFYTISHEVRCEIFHHGRMLTLKKFWIWGISN